MSSEDFKRVDLKQSWSFPEFSRKQVFKANGRDTDYVIAVSSSGMNDLLTAFRHGLAEASSEDDFRKICAEILFRQNAADVIFLRRPAKRTTCLAKRTAIDLFRLHSDLVPLFSQFASTPVEDAEQA